MDHVGRSHALRASGSRTDHDAYSCELSDSRPAPWSETRTHLAADSALGQHGIGDRRECVWWLGRAVVGRVYGPVAVGGPSRRPGVLERVRPLVLGVSGTRPV